MNSFRLTYAFTFLLLCLTERAYNQSWAIGMHFGEYLSTLRGVGNNDYLPGFMGGVQVSHYLSKNVVLRLETNFERKGARFQDGSLVPDPGSPIVGDDYRFDYLSLPIMLRYSMGRRTKFVVGGGISVDYLIRQRTEYGGLPVNEIGEYRRFDTDLLGAAGGSVPFHERWTFSLEMRALWGLIDVDKPKGLATELGKNLSWGLIAGVNYYL